MKLSTVKKEIEKQIKEAVCEIKGHSRGIITPADYKCYIGCTRCGKHLENCPCCSKDK